MIVDETRESATIMNEVTESTTIKDEVQESTAIMNEVTESTTIMNQVRESRATIVDKHKQQLWINYGDQQQPRMTYRINSDCEWSKGMDNRYV